MLWILCNRHSELDPPQVVSYLVCLHDCRHVTMWPAPGAGSASLADDNSGVGNHLRIIGRHRRWLLTAYPSGLTRVSQPPDLRLAWGQTLQFWQRSRADDSWPEGLCPTVLAPLDRPILFMIGAEKFRCFGFCGQTLRARPTTSGIIPCLFARLPARDNVAGPLEGTASPADDNSGVSNHLWIVRQHRRWLLTAYPSGLTRVSQPPDPRLAWGQTPQFRQRSWADDSCPEGLCPTVLAPLAYYL